MLNSRRSTSKRPLKREHAILIPLLPSSPALRWDITTVLSILHTRYPEANYPRYEEKLRDQGVNLLADVLHFDASFYTKTLGMEYGSMYLLRKCAVDGKL